VIDLLISEAAAHSIIEQAEYYKQASDSDLATRWELAVDKATRALMAFPESGSRCRFRAPQLAGLRWVLVPGFPNHLVFYRFRPEEKSILIVQVLHGARNLEVILKDDE
jgi:plasmid stabilization system protein ParE